MAAPDLIPQAGEIGNLFQVYQNYIASAQFISSSRNDANKFYLTIMAAAVVGYSFAFTQFRGAPPMLLGVSFAAMVFSFFWQSAIKRYGDLNKVKFEIIREIEALIIDDPRLRTYSVENEKYYLSSEFGWFRSFSSAEASVAFFVFLIASGAFTFHFCQVLVGP